MCINIFIIDPRKVRFEREENGLALTLNLPLPDECLASMVKTPDDCTLLERVISFEPRFDKDYLLFQMQLFQCCR